MVDLKPCPFCGSTDIKIGHWTPTSYHVFCHGDAPGRSKSSRECPAGGDCFITEEDALNWWNKRPIEDALRAELAAKTMTIVHVDSQVECERLRAELAELRASLRAKEATVAMGEGNGRHRP